MMLRLVQAGALQNSQSPIDTEEGAVMDQHGTFAVQPLVNFAHFRQVNGSSQQIGQLPNQGHDGQIRPAAVAD